MTNETTKIINGMRVTFTKQDDGLYHVDYAGFHYTYASVQEGIDLLTER